jgi:hypothetical protein
MVLERWTWEEAEERFRTGSVPQCSVTDYVFELTAGRLVLRHPTRTFWSVDRDVEHASLDDAAR